jgi:nucleoside-diphosphate-sugar epimerase
LYDSIVTGSAGFIGSHLSEALLARGDRVLGVDSFDPYYGRRLKRRNLSGPLSHPRFRFVEADLLRFPLKKHLGRGSRIYHLAGQPGVRGSWGEEFKRYTRNNIQATQAVYEAASRSGKGVRVIYASSSSIYGDQPPGAMKEGALPNPISPYGVTKLAAEHLGRLYGKAKGLPVTSLRFFTVYGPRQRPDMAFNRFIAAVSRGQPIDIYGDGRQLRDFTFVSDIVAGVVAAGEIAAPSPIYNLGGSSPVPLSEAVRTLGKVSGRPVRIRRLPLPIGDPRTTWADTRLARRELGFRPKVRLAEGLAAQLDWQVGGPRGP